MPLPQSSRRRVLIVEDDRMVRETLTLMLDDDYEVVVAASVSAGLTHLHGPDAVSIHVVLLDCLLPDGGVSPILTAADRQSIPVVLISGDPRQAEALDPARRFLSKPFSHATLLQVLDSARR
jgi:DNA-binding NtrC family response regulator